MVTTPNPVGSILALDVGDRRVGVAAASQAARLPAPLTTLDRNDDFLARLQTIIEENQASILVVGLPRGLEGQSTPQTEATKTFIDELRRQVSLPVEVQDEALTSRKAEEELEAAGKPYRRADIDALAATYILEDFLARPSQVPGEKAAA